MCFNCSGPKTAFFVFWILTGIGCFWQPSLLAYAFIGGSTAARLEVSREEPVVTFVWNGQTPSIQDKSAYTDIDSNLSDELYFVALLQKVAGIWNAVEESYIQIEIETDVAVSRNREDRIHAISVESVNLTSSAFASPNMEDGKIIDCDIVVGKSSVKARSLAFILLHELGHCLGLGHNHTEYNAVMGYSKQSRSLRLALDDRMGLSHLYPTDADAKLEQTFGCGVIAHGHSKHLPFWFLIPLLWVTILGLGKSRVSEVWISKTAQIK